MNDEIFSKAVILARAGQKEQARSLFQELLKEDRSNEMVWLWYVECTEELAERIQALEMCVRLNPQAKAVWAMLNHLRQIDPKVNDLGRTQPILTRRPVPAENEAAREEPCKADEWETKGRADVFTVSPDCLSTEEFTRIEESTAEYLLKHPVAKPVRDADDWSNLELHPTNPRQPRTRPNSGNNPGRLWNPI